MRILIVVNCLLALALSALIHRLLPFAHGVDCQYHERLRETCPPLSSTELWLTTLAPLAVLVGILFTARHLGFRSRRLAITVLLAQPLAIGLWAGWLAINQWLR
jgi:hypothetical protein